MITYIYTLAHPITNEIRYVGKTVRLKRRKVEHSSYWFCDKFHNHKNHWCLKLINEGLRPIMTVIDSTDGDWESLEKKWIKFYRDNGFRLLNATDGGEGQHGRKLPEEVRNKISINNKKTNASVSKNEVNEICNLIMKGKRYYQIKKHFPRLTQGCFYAIRSSRTWRDITFKLIEYRQQRKRALLNKNLAA